MSAITNELPRLFDRALYLARQKNASPTITAPLIERIADDLSDRLAIITRHFDRALLIAPDTGHFASVLRNSAKIGSLECRTSTANDDLELAGPYDAIFSMLDIHTVNDVPGYLAQVARDLKPDGLLMLSFFAGETLAELRDSWLAAEVEITGGASPRVAPMIAIRELGGLLQRAKLALPVADLDRMTLRYPDAFALMREVKAAGFANPLLGRSRNFVSQRFAFKVAEHYQRHFADPDKKIRATVELAWSNAWKPHESQPQPLKPGSAKARLADALKVPEKNPEKKL
jgi:SAM-dependent methyltransferase